jgi:hypothetical protein
MSWKRRVGIPQKCCGFRKGSAKGPWKSCESVATFCGNKGAWEFHKVLQVSQEVCKKSVKCHMRSIKGPLLEGWIPTMYRPHLRMIFQVKETIPMSIYASISTSFIHLRMGLNLICLKSMNLHHSFTCTWASPQHFDSAHQSVFLFTLHIKSNSSWTRHFNLPLSFKPEWFSVPLPGVIIASRAMNCDYVMTWTVSKLRTCYIIK